VRASAGAARRQARTLWCSCSLFLHSLRELLAFVLLFAAVACFFCATLCGGCSSVRLSLTNFAYSVDCLSIASSLDSS